MLSLATVWTTPYGIIGLLDSKFAWPSVLAVSAAGVLGTGLAFVIMGTLVGRVGSTRASFITYVIPVVALVLAPQHIIGLFEHLKIERLGSAEPGVMPKIVN